MDAYNDGKSAATNTSGPEQINSKLGRFRTILAFTSATRCVMLLGRVARRWNVAKGNKTPANGAGATTASAGAREEC